MVIIGNLRFRASGLESSLHLARCQAWLNQVGRVEKMTMTDPLGDMLTRIRNGQRVGHPQIACPSSSFRLNVLEVLEREGYIRGFREVEETKTRPRIEIELKYHEGSPVIRAIQRVSRPGRRIYASIKDLRPVNNGLGISILSTPRGVMSDAEARMANVGGEVLCTVV